MIGIFDSGIGGLTVLKEIERQLGQCGHLYIADSYFTPYGNRSTQEIIERSISIVKKLSDLGATIIVVACNTATAIAVETLRKKFSLPIVAMEPAVKPAMAHSRCGKVGILATTMTLSSQRYASLLEKFADGAQVFDQPCVGLVEQIENMQLDSPKTLELLNSYLQPLLEKEIDTMVLGCTHYPFLVDQITAITNGSIKLIDTAEPVTRELKRQMENRGLLEKCQGNKRYLTTGDKDRFQQQLNFYWQKQVSAESIRID